MTIEDWADGINPRLRVNLRLVLSMYVGRTCDVPHALHQCLLIVREEMRSPLEKNPYVPLSAQID